MDRPLTFPEINVPNRPILAEFRLVFLANRVFRAQGHSKMRGVGLAILP